jgi:MFS family permease
VDLLRYAKSLGTEARFSSFINNYYCVLAQIFGRRPIILIVLFLFILGSALAGAAQNMAMLIAARSLYKFKLESSN